MLEGFDFYSPVMTIIQILIMLGAFTAGAIAISVIWDMVRGIWD